LGIKSKGNKGSRENKHKSQNIGKANRAKGKKYERQACKWGLEHAGGVHPLVKQIASSTGRVGHYTDLQIDGVFEKYSLECKEKINLPKWFLKGVEQAFNAVKTYQNQPLIVLYNPSNGGKKTEADRDCLHIISKERHEELLKYEKEYNGSK